jgi:hypothetical protein
MSAKILLYCSRDSTQAWSQRLQAVGFSPISAEGLGQARWLAEQEPIAACMVIDTAQPSERQRLLRDLYRTQEQMPLMLVHGGLEPDELNALCFANPRLLTHTDGRGTLAPEWRLRQILKATLGDLEIHGRAIVHIPSGATFTHPVAFRLMTAATKWISIPRDGGGVTAVFRLRRWLARHSSSVSVEVLRGAGEYRMVA